MSEVRCPNDATFRYIWPGRDDKFCCVNHAQQIAAVAQAMGCPVYMHPITPDFAKDGWPQCESFEKEVKS